MKKETLLERLQREAREKMQKGSYSGQTKAGSLGAGFFTEEDVMEIIAYVLKEAAAALEEIKKEETMYILRAENQALTAAQKVLLGKEKRI
jgi:hypothetical protein